MPSTWIVNIGTVVIELLKAYLALLWQHKGKIPASQLSQRGCNSINSLNKGSFVTRLPDDSTNLTSTSGPVTTTNNLSLCQINPNTLLWDHVPHETYKLKPKLALWEICIKSLIYQCLEYNPQILLMFTQSPLYTSIYSMKMIANDLNMIWTHMS